MFIKNNQTILLYGILYFFNMVHTAEITNTHQLTEPDWSINNLITQYFSNEKELVSAKDNTAKIALAYPFYKTLYANTNTSLKKIYERGIQEGVKMCCDAHTKYWAYLQTRNNYIEKEIPEALATFYICCDLTAPYLVADAQTLIAKNISIDIFKSDLLLMVMLCNSVTTDKSLRSAYKILYTNLST